MRHKWKNVHGSEPRDIGTHGRRICESCGVEQEKFAQQVWGRVTGYRWEPLVGRCKGKTARRAQKKPPK